MTTTAIPQKPSRALQYLTLTQESRQQLPWWRTILGDPDYRQGKRDARRSPAIWDDSLAAINHEEALRHQEIQNVLAQNIRHSRETLARFPGLNERNQHNTEELRQANELLPEAMTNTILMNGNAEMALAWILLLVEIVSLTIVAKQSFGIGIIGAMTLAILITTCGALAMNKLLINVSPKVRTRLKWIMPIAGICLFVVGLLGFVLLREVAFNATLMDGAVDHQQLGIGNLMLMVGITLGVPLMVGILWEDGTEKRKKGINSHQVFQERKLLKVREAEWQTVFGRLEEYEKQLPELTRCKTQGRQLRYRKGFHRRAGRDPKAATFVQDMMAKR